MNTSTILNRVTAATIGIAAATVLVAPAANAQRDLLPTGPASATAPATAWSDSVDVVTEHKIAVCQNRTTAAAAQRPTGTSRVESLAPDIAYLVDTRKAEYARYRAAHARELAANR